MARNGKDTFELMVSLGQVYQDWQSNPTVNYLQTTGLPLSDIDFPSITICGQGSIYEVRKFVAIDGDHDTLNVFFRSQKMSSNTN